MKWRAVYQDKVLSEDWSTIPDGLLAVIIYRNGIHRLIGADYYWVGEDSYGMVYDGSCCSAGQSWWKNGVKMNSNAPDNVVLKAGLLLPDSEWQEFMEGIDAIT
jgi:hypothetical protein